MDERMRYALIGKHGYRLYQIQVVPNTIAMNDARFYK